MINVILCSSKGYVKNVCDLLITVPLSLQPDYFTLSLRKLLDSPVNTFFDFLLLYLLFNAGIVRKLDTSLLIIKLIRGKTEIKEYAIDARRLEGQIENRALHEL